MRSYNETFRGENVKGREREGEGEWEGVYRHAHRQTWTEGRRGRSLSLAERSRLSGLRVPTSPTTANLVNLNFQAQSRWQVSMRGEWRATGQDRLWGAGRGEFPIWRDWNVTLAFLHVLTRPSATLSSPRGKNISSHDYCYFVQ